MRRLLGGLALVLVVSGVSGLAGQDAAARRRTAPPFAVGLRIQRLVDSSRLVKLPGRGTQPRSLVTYVRYPAVGPASQPDEPDAAPDSADGPFPLIVFGHGFAVTPAVYARLLRAWAAAGYVVAAPVFPLGNANAPGGPDEADLINEPGDIRFVITQLLAESAAPGSALAGTIDPARVAVAGHSDGAEAALAVAYNGRLRDPRVRAAVILSGAEISGIGRYVFPPGGPALLASQGTADRSNPPKYTRAFFDRASRPRFLLTLLGARHLAPYAYEQPQLEIVERVTIAFLDAYLKAAPLRALRTAAAVPGVAALSADP